MVVEDLEENQNTEQKKETEEKTPKPKIDYTNTTILVTKKQRIEEEEEEQDVVIRTLCNIQGIVEYWIDQELIEGVKDITKDKEEIMNVVTNYSLWLSEPKVTGTKVIKVEIFFIIKTNTSIRELIQSQINFIQREQMRVEIKRTAEEHTQRVGMIVGPIVDRANLGWYEEEIVKKTAINKGEMELKKDMVYEGEERQ